MPAQLSTRGRKAALALAKDLREQFGRELREARLRTGMSQTDVGRITKKGQTYVSEIELGQANLTLDTMLLLAQAVGLDVAVTTSPARTQTKQASSA